MGKNNATYIKQAINLNCHPSTYRNNYDADTNKHWFNMAAGTAFLCFDQAITMQ